MIRCFLAAVLLFLWAASLHAQATANLEELRGILRQAEIAEREDRQGDLRSAATRILTVLESDLEHPYPEAEVLEIAARAFLLMGRQDEAYHHIRDAVSRYPEHGGCLGTKAMMHFREGNIAGGCEAVALAVKAGDRAPSTWFFRAVCLESEGKMTEALAALEKAEALDPTDPLPGVQRGAWLVRDGKMAEAESAFRAAVELAPNAPRVHASLAVFLEEADRMKDALPHWRSACDLDPSNFEWWTRLVAALEGLQLEKELEVERGAIRDARQSHQWPQESFPRQSIHIAPRNIVGEEFFAESGGQWHRYRFAVLNENTRIIEGQYFLTYSSKRAEIGERPFVLEQHDDKGAHMIHEQWEEEPSYMEARGAVLKIVEGRMKEEG